MQLATDDPKAVSYSFFWKFFLPALIHLYGSESLLSGSPKEVFHELGQTPDYLDRRHRKCAHTACQHGRNREKVINWMQSLCWGGLGGLSCATSRSSFAATGTLRWW